MSLASLALPRPFSRIRIVGKSTMRRCSCKLCHDMRFCRNEKSVCRENYRTVQKLWPVILVVGLGNVLCGIGLTVYVVLFKYSYDEYFGARYGSRMVAISCFANTFLAVTGIALIISIILDKRRTMAIYLFAAICLGAFLFLNAIVKLHLALIVFEEELKNTTRYTPSFMKGHSCKLLMLNIVGSLLHFICTGFVFTYYNFKYVHPIMFNCGRRIKVAVGS